MSFPRSALWSLLIGLVTLLPACASTYIEDTSPAAGNPRIVASDVKVKVTPYASAMSPAGGRIEEQQIIGQVVMSRAAYAEMLQRLNDNRLLGIYADECTQHPTCEHAAGKRAEALQ